MKDLIIVETITVNNQVIDFKTDGAEIFTDSLTVAKVFNKRHDNVLRDIGTEINLLFSEGIIKSNSGYIKSTYTDNKNREYPFYYMNKKNFTFLVMGFTGAKANKFKRCYIDAFEAIVESHQCLTKDNITLIQDNVRLKKEAEAREQALLPKTRESLDNMRRVQFKKIKEYFIKNNENEYVFSISLKRIYNLLHILTLGDIAVNILRDRVTQGLKSHNSGHSDAYLGDYAIALNYYGNDELDYFNKILYGLLEDVSLAIDENPYLTPHRVVTSMYNSLLIKIEARRNTFVGTPYQGKNRAEVNRLITAYIVEDIDLVTFDEYFNNLKNGRTFIL